MFVPGVNGSVIPSVSSGSKLKGAYKNSKKHKMPNGGLTYTPYTRVQNQYTDTPAPKPTVKPRVGDTITPNYTKLYTDLGVDAGSLLPGYIGKGFDVVSKLRSAGDDDYNQGLEFVPGKKANILSVVNDIQKISNAKPYTYKGRQMPNGGIKSSIENISPQGDVQYNVSKNLKNFRAGLQGSINAPSMYAGSVTPTLSYNKNKFSSYVSPNSLGASLEGDKAYLNYNQTREGQTMYRDASAGYNTDKVNLNAGVNFRNNSLESGQISGSYNFNPNFAIIGNYGVSQGESGLDKNYFAGLRFNKTFEEGGEVEDDDKEMVDGVASILRGVKDKKNRLQLANKLAKQFNREKVKYSLPEFLKKSKVKK
jgi:hypothetical protein